MKSYNISYRISPEVLKNDLVLVPFSGFNEESNCGVVSDVLTDKSLSVYSGLTYLLSGETAFTGMSIPILFLQSINDIGYYSEFDGFILQQDILTNFVYSGSQTSIYDVQLYNTSGENYVTYISETKFFVDWGDGTPIQQLSTNPELHSYINTPDNYTITLSGTNNFGTTIIKKEVFLPFTGVTITNQLGNVIFTPQGGNWSGIPQSYDFIYTGDSVNNIQSQITSSFIPVPYQITGYTTSKLQNLRKWGPIKYDYSLILRNNQPYGQITDINTDFTAYTINGMSYYDLSNGKTLYILDSSGLTANDILSEKITKDELLMDFVMAPEIITDVYIQRGKYSAFENLQRLGEVDNIGDLTRYGYGYFKINDAETI
jgi:hypothetical protein